MLMKFRIFQPENGRLKKHVIALNVMDLIRDSI